jgi:hypothetical protein
MVEASSQVRDALAQTRAEVADTIHALGERVDATRHAAEAVSGEADRIRSAAVQRTAKVADLGQHAVGSVASQLKAATPKQRLFLPMLLSAAFAFGVLALFIAKRRRDAAEEPLGWEATEE